MSRPKLPADIAGEAERLWQTDPRAALALLYRGLLSRLLHDFQLPANAAHTEGEVLQQVRQLQHESLAGFAEAPHIGRRRRTGTDPPKRRPAMRCVPIGADCSASRCRHESPAYVRWPVAVLLLGLLIIWLASQLQPYEDVVEHGPARKHAVTLLAAELFLRGLGLTVEHHEGIGSVETLPSEPDPAPAG